MNPHGCRPVSLGMFQLFQLFQLRLRLLECSATLIRARNRFALSANLKVLHHDDEIGL